jgi:glutamate N-acetyltransferase / amino-acid N-acetyltransferase
MAHPTVKLSPLALAPIALPPPIAGVEAATMHTGLRYKGRADLLLMRFCAGTTVAGLLTQSTTRAAPVEWCARHLPHGKAQALLVNAGNANAFTAQSGVELVTTTAHQLAQTFAIPEAEIMLASTGVIGEPLPPGSLAHFIPALESRLAPIDWQEAARAIMTTDNFVKLASVTAPIAGKEVRIVGFAKGAGMIEPNMATMLAFIVTDGAIAAPILHKMLHQACEVSFNAITVDGDTSTNDTVLAFATQMAGNRQDFPPDAPEWQEFSSALTRLCQYLAQAIVRDGEGASKFVTIHVTGAPDHHAARQVAKTIANSPLVKTAIAGEDANWGRIIAAAGRSGIPFDPLALRLRIGDLPVASQGGRDPAYDEAALSAHMRGQEIKISLDLALGTAEAEIWTCDLTHGYIDVNGSYRS